MPKRRKSAGGGGLELESAGMMRWLLTYADMITLLLALFIILYALASTSKSALQAVEAQFRQVFGIIPGNTSVLPNQSANPGSHYKIVEGEPQRGGPGGPKKPVSSAMGPTEAKIAQQLEAALQRELGANQVWIHHSAQGLVITLLTDKVLFNIGEYQIKPAMKVILNKISKVLRLYPSRNIEVEGHTDDLPVVGGRFGNWSISALRAAAVVKYLVTYDGLDPSKFAAIGYGPYQPLVPNISEANRRLNRRVDIVVMKLK